MASDNKNDSIEEQQDSDSNSITKGEVATKDDFQESKEGNKDKYKHLSEKSSMGGGFHPDNLNAVQSEDVQRKKGLEDDNEEKAKWSSADEPLGVDSNWGMDKKMKEVDTADQEV